MAQGSDGSIRFDTTIDLSGIQKGIKDMERAVDSFSQKVKKGFNDVDESIETTEKNAETLNDAFQINTEAIDQTVKKLDNVNAQIENQQKLLDQLKEKYERIAMAKGPDSSEALKLEKQILKTEEAIDKMIEKSDKLAKELNKLESSESEAASEMKDLEKGAKAAGKELEEVAGNASDAKGKLDDLDDSAEGNKFTFNDLSDILKTAGKAMDEVGVKGGNAVNKLGDLAGKFGEASVSSTAFAGVVAGLTVGAVAALCKAVDDLMKSTEEMRDGYAKLEANAESVGVSMETVKGGMEELNAVSEDFDANIETMSNLLQAGFTEANLATIVEQLSDAVIAFPDTMKFESLAESLQETIATKEATGQFAELLGRLGVNVEEFNKGLEQSARRGQEQRYIMETLSQTTLPGLSDAYKENNKEMVNMRKSSYELKEVQSELAREIEPLYYGFKTFCDEALKKVTESLVGLIWGIKDLIKWFGELGRTASNTSITPKGGLPSLPTGYAAGTSSAVPGWHLVGEEGPELVYFGGGETVLPAGRTRAYLSEPLGMYGGSPALSAYANQSSLADCAQRILDGFQSQVKAMTTNVRNVSSQTTYNIFKVDDIQTYQRIMERLEFEQQSERMGYTGGF